MPILSPYKKPLPPKPQPEEPQQTFMGKTQSGALPSGSYSQPAPKPAPMPQPGLMTPKPEPMPMSGGTPYTPKSGTSAYNAPTNNVVGGTLNVASPTSGTKQPAQSTANYEQQSGWNLNSGVTQIPQQPPSPVSANMSSPTTNIPNPTANKIPQLPPTPAPAPISQPVATPAPQQPSPGVSQIPSLPPTPAGVKDPKVVMPDKDDEEPYSNYFTDKTSKDGFQDPGSPGMVPIAAPIEEPYGDDKPEDPYASWFTDKFRDDERDEPEKAPPKEEPPEISLITTPGKSIEDQFRDRHGDPTEPDDGSGRSDEDLLAMVDGMSADEVLAFLRGDSDLTDEEKQRLKDLARDREPEDPWGDKDKPDLAYDSDDISIPGDEDEVDDEVDGGPQMPEEETEGWGLDPEVQDLWNKIQGQGDENLQRQLGDVDLQTAQNARRMAELNALTGGQVGGAFASGQAGAAMKGAQARSQAMQAAHKDNIQRQMAWLDTMMNSAESQKNRNFKQWLEQKRMELQRDLAIIEFGAPGEDGSDTAMTSDYRDESQQQSDYFTSKGYDRSRGVAFGREYGEQGGVRYIRDPSDGAWYAVTFTSDGNWSYAIPDEEVPEDIMNKVSQGE